MRDNDKIVATLVQSLLLPVVFLVAVLLPAFIFMIALNCVLDIHYPGHHVGYGEAYAIVYLLSIIRGQKLEYNKEENKLKTS